MSFADFPKKTSWQKIKPWLILLGCILLLVAILGGYKAYSIKKMIDGFAAAPEPVATVSALTAKVELWQPEAKTIGTLRALKKVSIASEVPGQLSALYVESGEAVSAGQKIAELDPTAENARLATLNVQREAANVNLARTKAQFAAEVATRAQLDLDTATLKTLEAQIKEQKVLLSKKNITAPFAGKIGIVTSARGQYVQPGQAIVDLQQLAPILVDFHLPQQALSYLKVGQGIQARVDSAPNSLFEGIISAIDPNVNPQTRNIHIEARLSNPNEILLPGMFANIIIPYSQAENLITLPQTAVTFNPYGETVFVIKPRVKSTAPLPPNAKPPALKDKSGKPIMVAQQMFVKTGSTRGDQIAILSGVQAGDMVITSGQLKLKNDMAVKIDNSVVPSNQAAPKVTDPE